MCKNYVNSLKVNYNDIKLQNNNKKVEKPELITETPQENELNNQDIITKTSVNKISSKECQPNVAQYNNNVTFPLFRSLLSTAVSEHASKADDVKAIKEALTK